MLTMLLLLLGSSTAWAKWPVQTPKTHPALVNYTQMLKLVNWQQARLSQSGFPDSAVIFSWDNNAWTQDNNVGIRYQNGKVSRLIFYISGIPALSYNFTYNASGRATLIEMILSIPGQQPQVMTRFTMNYDANGNQTSAITYEQQNGVLVQTGGDSLAITYNAGQPVEAIQRTYDTQSGAPAWVNTQRTTNFVFNGNGQATAVIFTPWDVATNSWQTAEETRYTNVVWNFGYAGFSALFGGLVDMSQFLFTELPFAENDYSLSPTDYIEEIKVGGNFVNNFKLTSSLANNRVSQVLEQEWSNNAWIDSYRVTFTYTGVNMTMAMEENSTNGNWVPDYRESWTYDAFNNLTEEKQESYMTGSWQTMYGRKHLFDYTSDNKVYRWISQNWDPMAMQYVNEEKREYYFGNFGLSATNLDSRTFKLYPNPVHDELWIDTNFEEPVQLQFFSMTGQLVQQLVIPASANSGTLKISLSNLTPGIYRAVVIGSNARLTQSIIKL